MAQAAANKTDDFFALLAEESNSRSVASPAGNDEVVFRDVDGTMKVLRGGRAVMLEPEIGATTAPLRPRPARVAVATVERPQPAKPAVDVDQEVKKIISASAVTLKDETTQRRLASIIKTRLNGARSQIQARQMLTSSLPSGGVGLDVATADALLLRTSQAADELYQRARQRPQRFAGQPVPPAAAVPERPAIGTAEFRPQLVGPVDELRILTLADFRQLAPTPVEAVNNIFEKIKVVEQESFRERLRAIEAWQQSQVNLLYLAVGRQGLTDGRGVAAVIRQRQAAHQPTLTEAEFTAISELNRRLRFHR